MKRVDGRAGFLEKRRRPRQSSGPQLRQSPLHFGNLEGRHTTQRTNVIGIKEENTDVCADGFTDRYYYSSVDDFGPSSAIAIVHSKAASPSPSPCLRWSPIPAR